MSGSESGGAGPQERHADGPGRGLSGRSASPAKRSAADMEGHHADAMIDDAELAGGREVAIDTDKGDDSNTETNEDADPSHQDYSTEQIDQQVRGVHELQLKPLDAGQMGSVVSTTWLARVLSRSSEGLKSSDYSKSAREGPVGPVDNSDVVPEGAFDTSVKDVEDQLYVPLRPGLVFGKDYEVLNDASWVEVVRSYGIEKGQQRIRRYVRNTAPPGAGVENLQYEVYPPTFTIRKVPFGAQVERPKPASAAEALRKESERKARGQGSPEDAALLVSSRQERFQRFLARSKEAVEIPISHKVRIWKVLNPPDMAIDVQDNKPPSPPLSREASPKERTPEHPKMVLEPAIFKDMEIGKDLESVDVTDETNNSNYNGKSSMELFDLFADATLLLEETVGGSDFSSSSDAKKALRMTGTKRLGSKPASSTASGRTSPAPASHGMLTRERQRRDGRTRGTVGLQNLGNTCYMNSALQCIRSVEELAIYFLSDKFKSEINRDNPLGHNGVMAKQYAGVLQGIYSDNAGGAFNPSNFKRTLGSIQPLFSGYGQQDSQEFLSFLVDALHEDLNRIQKKPYIENPDSDDKTVHDPQAIIDLGNVYRDNHAKRNDSVAMDLFNGFYKNTMECPECDKISITFDPYSLVTLQLPTEKSFQHTITFVPLRGAFVNHRIDTDRNATLKMLKAHIASKHKGVQADRLWMAEVYNHKIFKVFDDITTLAEAAIAESDTVFAFELEAKPSNLPIPPKKRTPLHFNTYHMQGRADDQVPTMDDAAADCFAVPVFSRSRRGYNGGFEMRMHPMYITVTREEARDYDVVLKKVLIAVSRLTSRPILTDFGPPDAQTPEGRVTSVDDGDHSAQVSDRSLPSDDGYVEVSVGKTVEEQAATVHLDDTVAASDDTDGRVVPVHFMDPEYKLSPTLRSQLFQVKYAASDGGLYCTGVGSIEREMPDMRARVKAMSRRSSMQSSSSDSSSSSTRSNTRANGRVDDSDDDVDGIDPPDIVMGPGSSSSTSTSFEEEEESDEDVMPASIVPQDREPRHGRQRNRRGNLKGRQRNPKTYSTRDRRRFPQGQVVGHQARSSQGNRAAQDDDDDEENPYYIKLGEGIILDWLPEGLDLLFGGDADQEEGHYVSADDGIALPVVRDAAVEEKRRRREERRKHGITLEECFAETGKRERLSEDNAWYCGRCKKLQQATKTLEIWTIPDILVVHLKRFGGNRSFRDKIDTMVDYPVEGLDMTRKIGCREDGKEYIYDLFAVDNHFGGLGGGHYTAMAKSFYDGEWYDYNDSTCHKIGERNLHSSAAYLLFYRRRSELPLGPQYLQEIVAASRHPPGAAESGTEEMTDEADAGEGRLGGPTSSLRGSSSVSAAAGAAAARRDGHRPGGGSAGVAAAVDSSLTTRTSPRGGDEGGLRYSDTPAWDFAALNDDDDLTHHMGGPVDEDSGDNVASDVADAESDDSSGSRRGAYREGSLTTTLAGDDEDDNDNDSDGGMDAWGERHDDHALYSGAHATTSLQDATHLQLELEGAATGTSPRHEDDGGPRRPMAH